MAAVWAQAELAAVRAGAATATVVAVPAVDAADAANAVGDSERQGVKLAALVVEG